MPYELEDDEEDDLEEPETALALVSDGATVLSGPDERRANPVGLYLASLGNDNSRRTTASSLKRALDALGKPRERWYVAAWWTFGIETGELLRARLMAKHGPATTKLTLSAVRQVLHQCWRLGYLDYDRFQRVTSWGKVLGSSEELAGRMLDPAEVGRVRKACAAGGPFWGVMDAGMYSVGLGAGARREELACMRLSDVSDDCRVLSILGKRSKRRIVPVPKWTTGALETWLTQRARFPFQTDRLFVRCNPGGGADRSLPLSKWQVWRRMRDLGDRAKVRFTPHDLRRTFISMALEKHDIATVSKMAGHSDVRTTARYDRRPMKAREAVARTLDDMIGEVWAKAS